MNQSDKNQLLESETELSKLPLKECVERALEQYFNDMDGHEAKDLYELILSQVEKPLLESVCQHTKNNMSAASRILGIHPTTLRTKMRKYGLYN